MVVALLFLPTTGVVERLLSRLIPDKRIDADRLGTPRYLDPIAFSMPPVALSNAALETVRMSEVLDQMLDTALTAMHTGNLQATKLVTELDDRLNTLHGAVQSYLSELTKAELSLEESRRALDITMYVSNLEHAGDVICLSLCDRITVKAKENITFTTDEQASLDNLCRFIQETLGLATAVLTSSDLEGAKRLLARKESFHSIENRLLEEHFRIGVRGNGRLLRCSALYVDMIRELHRIDSLIVSAGYPVINAAGRLREPHTSKVGPAPA